MDLAARVERPGLILVGGRRTMRGSMVPAQKTFAIRSCLGRGGFCEVYRAEMADGARALGDVALKVLRRDMSSSGQAVQRLKDEARALERLKHPSILRIIAFIELDQRFTLVTEYVEGEDLSDWIRGPDPIPDRVLVEVVSRVADALDAAYQAPDPRGSGPLRVIHRDVKPSNIRIGRHGTVKLLDFGIARSDEITREAHTATDIVVGSPYYMAPERFRQTDPDPASDVYALGAVLYEGVVRERFLDRSMPVIAALAIDVDRYQAFLERRIEQMPQGATSDLARAMLAFDPRDRPTAAEVMSTCDRMLEWMDGPDVATYCLGRAWSPPKSLDGEWVGRVLTERGR